MRTRAVRGCVAGTSVPLLFSVGRRARGVTLTHGCPAAWRPRTGVKVSLPVVAVQSPTARDLSLSCVPPLRAAMPGLLMAACTQSPLACVVGRGSHLRTCEDK